MKVTTGSKAKLLSIYEIGKEDLHAGAEHKTGFTFGTDFNADYSTDVTEDVEASLAELQTQASWETEAWAEFIEGTTFHGIKYIFQTGAKNIRRGLWILFVLMSVGLFFYQVISRALDYAEFPSSVNIQRVYEDDVIFPAVTVCNQNNFRLSAAVEEDVYAFLDNFYGGVEESVNKFSFDLEENVTNLYLKLAHQRSSFIEKCEWSGEMCDLSTDFKTVFTDFGICYTFNHNSSSRFKATRTGTSYGLKLVLNIEGYEYMKGPHNEAGIKILLHENETPLVSDLGFAAPPGTQSLVAINRAQITSLGAPHGVCEGEADHRSNCLVRCRAEQMLSTCGCFQAYMMEFQSAPVCSTVPELYCAASKSANNVSLECKCALPCQQVQYKPELSYAHLSSVSLENIWRDAPGRTGVIIRNFKQAMELKQRVRLVTRTSNEQIFNETLISINQFGRTVNESVTPISNKGAEEGLERSLYYETSVWVDSLSAIDDKYKTLQAKFTKPFPGANPLPATSRLLLVTRYSFLGPKNDINRTLDQLIVCARTGKLAGRDCPGQHLATASENIQGFIGDAAHDAISELSKYPLTNQYETKIDKLYGDTSFFEDVLKRENHLSCIQHLRNLTDKQQTEVSNLSEKFSDYLHSTSFEEQANITLDIYRFVLEQYAFDLNSDIRDGSTCNWYLMSNQLFEDDTAYATYSTLSHSAQDNLFEINDVLPITRDAASLLSAIEDLQNYTSEIINNYLNESISMETLQELVVGQDFKQRKAEMFKSHDRYISSYSNHLTLLMDNRNRMAQMILKSYDFVIEVMTNDTVESLSLVTYYKGNAHYKQGCGELVAVSWPSRAGLNQLLTVGVCPLALFSVATEQRKDDFKHSYETLKDTLTKFEGTLTTFEESLTIDEDFFMDNYIQVDVFYKELSDERINQQVSFTFISLLSEVGGFLGLLLGASVLTVCEIFDYLAVVSLKRCRRRKGKNTVR